MTQQEQILSLLKDGNPVCVAEILDLTLGRKTIVDKEDYKELSKYKWFYTKVGYAARDTWDGKKKKRIYMHRVIAKTPEGLQTDHVNHNRVDNRKSNLRVVTKSQNMMNGTVRAGKIHSSYRGVTKGKYSWIAQIQVNKKHINIGSYKTELEAAKAYNSIAKVLFGEYANLNTL